MKRLGKVLHVSSTGNIVLRAVRVPEIGTKVVDERMKEIGAVYDIIGPVGSPYVLVKPSKDINPELTMESHCTFLNWMKESILGGGKKPKNNLKPKNRQSM